MGIISALVLLAINPEKKINLSKDARVKSDLSQIVNALQTYYVNPDNNSEYPSAPDGLTALIRSGELKSLPYQQDEKNCPGTPDGTTIGTSYCYVVLQDELESKTIAIWGSLFSKGLLAWCWDSTTGTFTEKKEGEALPTAENPYCKVVLPTETPTPTNIPISCSDTIIVSDTSNDVYNAQGNRLGSAVLAYNQNSEWTVVINGASWIWKTYLVENPTINETYYFRKNFAIEGNINTAILTIAADNEYAVWVNGTEVGSGGGFRVGDQVQYEVKQLLRSGSNSLEARATNGAGVSDPRANPGGLLYRLQITRSTCPSL